MRDAWILLYRRRRTGRVVPDKNHPGMWRSVKSTEREFWKGRTAVNYWMSTAKLP